MRFRLRSISRRSHQTKTSPKTASGRIFAFAPIVSHCRGLEVSAHVAANFKRHLVANGGLPRNHQQAPPSRVCGAMARTDGPVWGIVYGDSPKPKDAHKWRHLRCQSLTRADMGSVVIVGQDRATFVLPRCRGALRPQAVCRRVVATCWGLRYTACRDRHIEGRASRAQPSER